MHEVGFEPTKLYALDLKSNPFDHSGTRAIYTIHLSLYSKTQKLKKLKNSKNSKNSKTQKTQKLKKLKKYKNHIII